MSFLLKITALQASKAFPTGAESLAKVLSQQTKLLSDQVHVASERNSGYNTWMFKASIRTYNDSAKATFIEVNKYIHDF